MRYLIALLALAINTVAATMPSTATPSQNYPLTNDFGTNDRVVISSWLGGTNWQTRNLLLETIVAEAVSRSGSGSGVTNFAGAGINITTNGGEFTFSVNTNLVAMRLWVTDQITTATDTNIFATRAWLNFVSNALSQANASTSNSVVAASNALAAANLALSNNLVTASNALASANAATSNSLANASNVLASAISAIPTNQSSYYARTIYLVSSAAESNRLIAAGARVFTNIGQAYTNALSTPGLAMTNPAVIELGGGFHGDLTVGSITGAVMWVTKLSRDPSVDEPFDIGMIRLTGGSQSTLNASGLSISNIYAQTSPGATGADGSPTGNGSNGGDGVSCGTLTIYGHGNTFINDISGSGGLGGGGGGGGTDGSVGTVGGNGGNGGNAWVIHANNVIIGSVVSSGGSGGNGGAGYSLDFDNNPGQGGNGGSGGNGVSITMFASNIGKVTSSTGGAGTPGGGEQSIQGGDGAAGTDAAIVLNTKFNDISAIDLPIGAITGEIPEGFSVYSTSDAAYYFWQSGSWATK